jgi:hypothetical protein
MVARFGRLRDGDLAVGMKARLLPVGATTIGLSYFVPRISALMSIWLTSTSRRGRSWNFRKPSRLARKVASSSVPVAM